MKSSGMKLFILIVVMLGLWAIAYFGIGSDAKTLSVWNIARGLDLNGGVYIVYEAEEGVNPSSEEMDAAVSMIRERLDRRNWTEAEVSKEGNRRIRLEIPGIDNPEEAIEEIGQTAELFFMDSNGQIVVEGKDVANATKAYQADSMGNQQIVVSLEFNAEGTQKFSEATKNNVGKPIYIMMDNTIISAPNVNEQITGGKAVITGDFDDAEAKELAELIKAGSLPFKLNILEYNTVGATLGANALSTSLIGGTLGIILVFAFMLIYYKIPGIAAILALLIYIPLDLILINALDVTLTLPGIAGVVLSVGMAVDANVIIFERIREELKAGKTLKLSVNNGFSRAFSAIIDANITTIIAGAVLFWLGTGPIKGFAITLILGIVISMITAIVITRFILTNMINAGIKNPKFYSGR